ncbi:MAG: translation initiation factor IF-2 [Planctomycetales bacterium]|nr:translation initiation factor IF-2 [Planctomycetales bacterium]
MPIRIYALARELKIDSKELVDVCAKAGITGKGSALASLSDDETAKLKSFLAGGSTKKSAPAREATGRPIRNDPSKPITRDDYISPGAGLKPKVIVAPKPPKPAAPTTESPSTMEVAAEAGPDAGGTTPEPAVDIRPAAPPAQIDVPKPPPIAPTQATIDAPVRQSRNREAPLTPFAQQRQKAGGAEKRPKAKPGQQKREPVVRMAAIPKTPQPKVEKKANEPAPQKPIMTLPADAIRNAKSGMSAPLEQFTKQADKKRDADRDEKRGKRFESPGGEEGAAGKARRGKVGRTEEGEKSLAAMSNTRAARQQKRKRSISIGDDDSGDATRRRRRRLVRKGGTNTAAPRKGRVSVETPISIRGFSEATGVPSASVLKTLMGLGTMATINMELDLEMAELIAAELDLDVDFNAAESLEDKLISTIDDIEDDPDTLQPRPPVITFLGHVDHGKTSLLDRIISLDVVSGEAGGITQHIRAYKIKKDGREIAFVDTPGHEAFTEMRARGAHVTDIAVLVVAADDGIMPQTEEAISHARAAGVPIVVALNKIDLPGADPNIAYQGLAQHDLLPVEWGGDVEVVKTSAITGEGIDDLLETLLLTADLHEYTANPDRKATGTCLEAEQEGNRGVVAKIIVQKGTLKVGDVIVCGGAHGRVKAMYDTLNVRKRLKEAGPSTPVNVTGLDVAPGAGDPFYVLGDISAAREIAETRQHESRSQSLSGATVKVSFIEFQRRLEEGRLGQADEVSVLNIILRADVRGSIEAIQKELGKLDHPEVKVNILQASVGGITSADVTLADASDAVIVGFNVIPDEAARSLADERGVEIRRYDIIYKVTEDLKALLEGRLKPEERIKELGRALVQRVFTISRLGAVAGCRVLAGNVERGSRVRVNREGRGIGDYPIDSLKREKDDAKEVREGYECGIKLAGFNDLKEGDILEAYKVEEVARTL